MQRSKLKGRHIIAQGNALGHGAFEENRSPEGAAHPIGVRVGLKIRYAALSGLY